MCTRSRALYLVTAVGYAAFAFSSWDGVGPPWPNRVTFGLVSFMAAGASVGYALTCRDGLRRLMVSAVMVAVLSRTIGWWVSTVAVSVKIGNSGALAIVGALMLLANSAARRGLR